MRLSQLVLRTLAVFACSAAALAGCERGAPAEAGEDAGGPRRRPTPTQQIEEPTCVRAAISENDVPNAYTERTNPLAASDEVLAAGSVVYGARCAFCHGKDGRGRGTEAGFDPPAADFTLLRRSDAFLFWRISEGGYEEPFCSAMPPFGGTLSATARWQLVAFIQRSFAPGGVDAADAGALDASASD